MKKLILLFMILLLFLVGCNKTDVQSDYPNAIGWNDLIYGLSVEKVPREKLVKKIGGVQRKKEPMPVKNGDVNFVDVGSSIYVFNILLYLFIRYFSSVFWYKYNMVRAIPFCLSRNLSYPEFYKQFGLK